MIHKYPLRNFSFLRIIKLSLLLLLIQSCQDQDPKPNTDSNSVETDSIFILIEEGRRTDLSNNMRAVLLQKALLKANNSNNDSLKPRYFSKLSLAYLNLKDSLLFRKTNRKSLTLALGVNDSTSLAEAHWDLGAFLKSYVQHDSAYFHYREAYKLYLAKNNNLNAARLLYNMTSSQMDVKDYTGAEINAFKAISLLEPLEEYRRLYSCYNLLGSISKELNEFERSLEYFNTASDYLNQIEDQHTRTLQSSFLQNNIANVYKDQNQFEKAIPYYRRALANNDIKEEYPIDYARCLDNLAYSRFKSGDTLNVKEQLLEALGIRKTENDIAGIAKSHFSLAEYYLMQGDQDLALENANHAKDFAKQSSSNNRLLETLGLLTQIDKDKTLEHSMAYIHLNDSLILEERKARDKFTRIRFETNQVSIQNEELTRKKQIWTGIAIGTFLLGLAVYMIIDQRSKNQALRFQQQQQASNQEIFELMLSQKQKIEDSKKKEQKRISEELHDGVLGKMLGARMVLTGLNKRDTPDAIEERANAISALKDIEGEVRSISHELSHAAYQNIDNFINSIKELLNTVSTANNINYTFEYSEEVDWDLMKGDLKINLYRMVQESLQNSVKHSECKNILVNFVSEREMVIVTISDDGKGFKQKAGKKGIGMRNIESRVSKLNGSWDISSEIGEGTTITFRLPMNENHLQDQVAIESTKVQNIE